MKKSNTPVILVQVEHTNSSSGVKVSPSPSSSSKFYDTCSEAEGNAISKGIAKFFFRCNIAFTIIDAAAFRNMIKYLRPAYYAKFLYHKDKLRTTMLNNYYDELLGILKDQVKRSRYFVFTSDGYETHDGRHFVNIIVHTAGNPPLLYKVVNTSTFSLNKHAMVDILTQCATELGIEKWLGCVMDSASVNQATEKLIEEQYPKVLMNGCLAHSHDLLIENL